MAAEVSSLVRVMGEQHRTVGNEAEKSTALITRDLLGGSSVESQELDLDLQVPTGWEKRLDLQSGKVYIQRCNNTLGSLQVNEQKLNQVKSTTLGPKLQDLNFPSSTTQPSSKVPLNLFDDTNLDLKLVSSSSISLPSNNNNNNYQSVCTLDKVKSALERAEKEPILRKRTSFLKSVSSPSSYSSSSSSIREMQEEESDDNKMMMMMMGNSSSSSTLSSPIAAGCPGCLSYVLILKNNPKCPRCNTIVPMPSVKKPRIDLNISI
ncbi:hypothetical protein HN51_026206 [Arachis hypogaea]|uniref:GIR1-like zinc ribbon domain-containing protein n=2 Tax=Arachis TaxID=3817 RepID=A0A445CH14_ARAHY|nr:uncharacterized protein LOC107458649 [Arachis duranensis]XP_025610568.1 uncharacterized protein LOC112703365 [Arachis hypogaea]QHO28761.1 uncharacterized protein DS421_7g219490 [Arachis hypogaea]RYR50213.1 hypothetical protein Ahy_A07g036816 [Arachis hypogaea]